MKAWLLDSFTGLSALYIAEVSEPIPREGEVLLEVEYASLNPADRYLAQNEYPAKPPLPHILGRDGVGTVVALGPGVSNIRIGERLVILRGDTGVKRWGNFAQRVAVAAESLVKIPQGWTDQQAAAAPLVYLTAYQALTQWRDLAPGIVLVTGASGGVGIASLHLARALGHSTVALSRSESKRKKLLELGATFAIDPTQPDWPTKLRDTLNPKRVDLAIDNLGGPEFSQILETLGPNGKVSVVGRLAGPVPEFNTAALFFRRLKIGGVAVSTYTAAEFQQAWGKIVPLMNSIGAKPLVDSIFPFEELINAFEKLAAGPMGKVLLDVTTAEKK
ncbi:MAG: zinc-binding alcohol dehydrogenase family protein [Tepidisphaeraceae bacterium]|jgi:NADPH2:quinone reductase